MLALSATLSGGVPAASAQGAAKETPKESPKAAAPKDAPKEAAKEPPKLAEDIHETVVKLPVTVRLVSGKKHSGQMVLTHYRPAGDGPFPVVVFNHGRRWQKDQRAEFKRIREIRLARYFTRRGFAVFVPTRLGYGDSGIEIDPEGFAGSCTKPDDRVSLDAMLAQIVATVNFAKAQSWADTGRVVLSGQSFGGFASIGAAASKQINTVGAITFAGGTRMVSRKTGEACSLRVSPEMTQAARQTKAPMLWFYAENDRLWSPDVPRKWHAAYVKAGGKAEMVMFPPVGENGHFLIVDGFHLWRPIADRFLHELGFPAPRAADAPPPTDYARLDETDKLPFSKTAKQGYERFLKADVPRAFAISTRGAWAWQSGENAVERVLQACREGTKGTCHLYAVDDAVVFRMPESAEATPAR